MRQTPVNDYLEDISTELPEEIYGYLSDAIYETVCEFDEEVAQLKAENAKLRNEADNLLDFEHLTSVAVAYAGCDECGEYKQTMLRLFAENAKLCELMQEMYNVIAMLEDANDEAVVSRDGVMLDAAYFAKRMRELGAGKFTHAVDRRSLRGEE